MALILLHGFTGHAGSFDRVVQNLERITPQIEVYPVTLPGHGTQPAPHHLDESLNQIREQILRFRPASAIRSSGSQPPPTATWPVDLIGYSMGGRLALHYALKYPQDVRSLTLFGARPGISDLRQRKARLDSDRQLAGILRRYGMEKFLQIWEAQPLLTPRTSNMAAIADAQAIRRQHDPRALARALETFSVAALPDLWPHLRSFTMPVRWIYGEFDDTYRTLMTRAARETGTVHTILGAGHSVLLDAPTEVASILI